MGRFQVRSIAIQAPAAYAVAASARSRNPQIADLFSFYDIFQSLFGVR